MYVCKYVSVCLAAELRSVCFDGTGSNKTCQQGCPVGSSTRLSEGIYIDLGVHPGSWDVLASRHPHGPDSRGRAVLECRVGLPEAPDRQKKDKREKISTGKTRKGSSLSTRGGGWRLWSCPGPLPPSPPPPTVT